MIKNYRISNPDFWNLINADYSNNGGIYQLYCLDENDNRIQTNRILKSDEKGILYIGKATQFLDRVITLKKSLSPDYISANHECGFRYKNLGLYKSKFPYENLWIELSTHTDIHIEEKRLLGNYEVEFGELPPLNRNK